MATIIDTALDEGQHIQLNSAWHRSPVLVSISGYLFGPRHLDLNVYSSVTATTRHYSNSVALDDETKNARIWLGLHFRTGMNAGNKIGHEASHWVITDAFEAVCDCHGR